VGITGTLKLTKSWSMHDIGSYLEGSHLKMPAIVDFYVADVIFTNKEPK